MATLFTISAVFVILFILNQAGNMGASWEFNLIGLLAIVILVFGLIRTWLRP
jgi:hypothetical protein